MVNAELADRALGTNETDLRTETSTDTYSHCFEDSGFENFGRKVDVVEKRSKACPAARKKQLVMRVGKLDE